MNIAVLYKYTADSREVTIREDGSPDWSAARKGVGEDDAVALAYGAALGERLNAEVVAVTVGGADASSPASVRSALAKGVTSARVVADDTVLGWNHTRIAAALATLVERIGDVELVLTGARSIDDSAHLMPSLVGGFLRRPVFQDVSALTREDEAWIITQKVADGTRTIRVAGPVVCGMTPDAVKVQVADVRALREASSRPTIVDDVPDLPEDLGRFSAIGWERPVPRERRGKIFTGEGAARRLARALKEEGVL